jgi:protein O-mannosyl-transferase
VIALRTSKIIAAALLISATLLSYLPALRGGFIFDDDVFVTDNPLIQSSSGLRQLWFSRDTADYWPVTSSTFWVEWRYWGHDPIGYHVTNVLLHAATVLLLWAGLRRLRIPGAFYGALLFAVHPLNASTVTWITERKNLLALLFFLLTIECFLRAEPGEPDVVPPRCRRIVFSGLSLGAFALAMLSKSSAVTLPLVLVGIMVSRKRFSAQTIAWRLAPYVVIAVALAAIQAQFSTVLETSEATSLGALDRGLRAFAIVCFYAGKMIWPANLSFDYGSWQVRARELQWWAPSILVVGGTWLLWRYRHGWARLALPAWLFILVTLLPVVGLREVGFMKYSPVANHYAHLALIGFAAWAGATLAAITDRLATLRLAIVPAVLAFALAVLTLQQSRVYAHADSLYRDTIVQNPSSWLAHTNLGGLLIDHGEVPEATTELEAAVRLNPQFAPAHNNLGIAYYRTGDLARAVQEYAEAIRLRPSLYQAHNNLGVALAQAGDVAGAITHFQVALRYAPEYAAARANLVRAQRLQTAAPPGR